MAILGEVGITNMTATGAVYNLKQGLERPKTGFPQRAITLMASAAP